jgi:hypothetical protein
MSININYYKDPLIGIEGIKWNRYPALIEVSEQSALSAHSSVLQNAPFIDRFSSSPALRLCTWMPLHDLEPERRGQQIHTSSRCQILVVLPETTNNPMSLFFWPCWGSTNCNLTTQIISHFVLFFFCFFFLFLFRQRKKKDYILISSYLPSCCSDCKHRIKYS